jgi:hypothetical protein
MLYTDYFGKMDTLPIKKLIVKTSINEAKKMLTIGSILVGSCPTVCLKPLSGDGFFLRLR